MPPIRTKDAAAIQWNFFTKKTDMKAQCNLCKALLSYKSTSNNLKKHLMRKHPGIKLHEDVEVNLNSERPAATSSDQNVGIVSLENLDDPGPSTSSNITSAPTRPIQTSVANYVRKTIPPASKKKINDALLLLFTKDLQPFSIVQDAGFKQFVNTLDPKYQLPSRRHITDTLLPAAYEEVYNEVKQELREVKSVTLTTDSWTSRNTDSFLGVTAHYIKNDFQLRNVLLGCVSFKGSHTSINYGLEIAKIIKKWNLESKILIIISDNAPNIKKAIKEELKLKHFGCFAHTLNLVTKDALNSVESINSKIRSIVGHFKRSTSDNEKFLVQQQKLWTEKNPKKFIQDVPTRWNSTFYMLERFSELEEAIRITLALINKDLPVLVMEEWEIIKELVDILRPLENVTNIMSAEKYLTASLVIVLTDCLLSTYKELTKNKTLSTITTGVVTAILEGLQTRVGNIENSNSLGIATFLDPRFKMVGFSNTLIAEGIKKHLISMVTHCIQVHKSNTERRNPSAQNVNKDDAFSIWNKFDKKVANYQPVGNSQSQAIIEVQRYIDEPPIERNENPLNWWKMNAHNFPNISNIFKEKCICVATSVPCERLFSKSGFILSERRNRLGATNVEKLLFLNLNSI